MSIKHKVTISVPYSVPNSVWDSVNVSVYGSVRNFVTKDGYSIDISLFTKKELSFVIAFLDKTSDGYDLRTVGARPFNLLENQFEAFHKIGKFAFRYLEDLEDED